jgi:AcrR family transcriptional regulator
VPRRDPESTANLRASLLRHARRLVERDGPQALTMRALAAEAACAIGLPYKVFADRDELVAELVLEEFSELRGELDGWTSRAGTGTVGSNLARYAAILLERELPAWEMVGTVGDDKLSRAAAEKAGPSGLLASFDTAVRDYLAAEQRLGRVAREVDPEAWGFLITGAIHNLLIAGPGYPRPSKRRLARFLAEVAERIGPKAAGSEIHDIG